ncbi:sperm-associated antigen 17 isoform X3 [Coregonus clupeaformis]|uniref:sperm-associated antigen 17 isoform X3 n=1 Tax=Coregonus clupeaformis TaxID=59861 RepID=UPI001E1C96A4|nr:sperm-associated antigen 17 isoform X3 [Coregonus clupeaformis]
MPPKRVKSGTVSAAGATAVGNKAWETGLSTAPFEEETWKASISLVVGERLEDEELIGALLLAVQQPLRRLFSVVTWDATLEKIHELGNPKIKKTKDAPMFYEVMEAAKVLLDAGEELPCDLLGKLLKFQLLGVKTNDQQRRAAEMRAAEEKAKGKAGNASPTKDKGGAKPAAKGDKGKKGSEPSAPTKDTKLKKRGEEDETNKYIDDEPDDGPQHYVLVVGFQQAQLVSVLDSLGVHVSNVIKLTSQRPDRPEGSLEGSDAKPLDRAKCCCCVPVDAEANIRRRQREQFWGQLEGVLNSGSALSKLFDVARLSLTAKEILSPQDKDNPEAMLGFGTRLFEDVACLIYDCLDWRRQHQHYLNNMRLVQVPSVTRAGARTTQENPAEMVQTTTPQTPGSKKRQAQEETPPADPEPAALSTDVDMRYYNDLLDQIPPEASSVPLILHCMLEQVVATEQDSPPLSAAGSEKGLYSLEKSLADYMLSAVISLPRSDQEKKKLRETFGAVENTQQKTEHQRPLLINCHDERALRLHHLPVHNSFDVVKTEKEMMRNSPVWNLLCSVRPLSGNRTRLARIQELTHYCTDESLSWPEVERVVRQFVFESMPLTQLEEGGLLTSAGSPQPTCLPWDDPVSFAKNYLRHSNKTQGARHTETSLRRGISYHLSDSARVAPQKAFKAFQQDESEESLSDVVDVTEIQRSRVRSLRDWHYTEHHNANVFPQILQSASQSYRCMDTFCGSLDNTLFIVCHNPMSPQRQCKELWDMALHTNVGFRKYLEHVADSISDWTKEEEDKWLALQAKREADKLRGPTPSDSSEKGRTESAKGTKKDTVSPKHTAMLCPCPPEASPAKSPIPEEPPPCPPEASPAKSPIPEEPPPCPPEASPAKSPIPEEPPPDQYIREDSLKAWKLEQSRQKEEEQVKKAKKDKGGKGAERADSSKENKKTTPSTTKKSREDVSKTPDLAVGTPGGQRAELQSPTDVFTGFTGYSMEGQLIQVSGQLHSLYPSDGGHIQVETIHFVQGSTLIKVCVMKDKHHFYTHITQPNRHHAVHMETQSPANKSVRLGSFSAVLDNGIHLSYSRYGPTGEQGEMQAGQDSDLDMPTDSSLSPAPSTLLSSSFSNKKLNSSHSSKGVEPPRETNKSPTPREEKEQTRESESQAALPGSAPFQRLNVSTPSGLLLQFLSDDTDGSTPEGQCVLVRQSFPLHCSDSRELHLTDPSLHSELSRVITGQGTVVKYMRDGSTQVLFADSSVSTCTESGPIISSPPEPVAKEDEVVKETQTPERKDSKDKKGKLGSKQSLGADQSQSDPEPREDQRSSGQTQARQGVCWTTTSPSGHRVATMGDQTTDPGPVLAFRATDPVSQTVVITREDKVISVLDRDGTVIVDHADGTRITTLYQEREALCGWSHQHINTGERSSSSVCHKEKVVMVERLGFATVAMFSEDRSCKVFFGDGSVVTATCNGAYHVYPSSVGLLLINQDGSCVYRSDPEHSPTLSLASWSPREQPGSYRMDHTSTSDTLCEVTDHHGNLFQVMKDGRTSVEISSPLDSRVEEEEMEEEEMEEEGGHPEERELAKHYIGRKVHIPRLFMAHEDGSGTELLYSQTVEERLYEDYSDPAVALLKEPLPDLQGVLGITVLRPCLQDVWSRWVIQKQNKDIIPTNLKSRRWDNFPSVERKTPGPPFGTTLGRGLTLREKPVSEACRPVLSCPDTLEVRQLLQYQPVSRQLRRTLESRLREYMEQVVQRENLSEKMQLKDPRTEEEKVHAADLLKLVLSLPESENPTIENRIFPVDVATMYTQALMTPALQTEASLSEKDTDSFSEEAQETMWKSRIEQHRQELDQEKMYREALRNRIIPPYFHSEKGAGFEYSEEVPDMRSLSQDLPPFPKTPNSQNYLKDAPRETAQRPLNPTPSHAAGSDALPVRRPTNPTPQTAVEQQHGGGMEPGSTQVDVAGNPRRHRVKLPASILSSKPFSVPNQQFLCVEEPVRRKVKTVSVTGGQQLAPRGFELLPAEVQFGTLKEGCTYSVPVLMKNVGFHTCRFSVKQPSPGTGIRVIYTPGPVAAGMKTELQVELYAMAIGLEEPAEGEVYVSHHIHIKTESEILYLPVSATILPERLYDSRTKDHTNWLQTGVSKVRLISSTPSVRRGVVLPHRPLLSTTGEIE